MQVSFKIKLLLVLFIVDLSSCHDTSKRRPWKLSMRKLSSNMTQSYNFLQDQLNTVTRQLMLQQYYTEERVRSEGCSGVKQVRNKDVGEKNYYSSTHVGGSVAAIHEHANHIATVGMGELDVVMNGVEFRTRHNDYRLYMPHRTSAVYHRRENIPFPDVPPEVSTKANVDEQIIEMREWFKAFRDQNDTIRDYKKYFKPILCYLEGGWTNSGEKFEEGISSDRHFVDANSWHDLQMKNMFTSASGAKSRFENLAFLPTTVSGFDGDLPKFAQWNYRILCHPLKKDLSLDRFHIVEDLSARMNHGRSIYEHYNSRAARFQIFRRNVSDINGKISGYTLLDELMEEIPGVDNYQGHINGTDLDGNIILNADRSSKDMSRYHRWYHIAKKDAMGRKQIMRGFSDCNLFAAATTQDKIIKKTTVKCQNNQCGIIPQRWTYAIPLEVIYLTPLSKWNPHNIPYKGSDRASAVFKSVNAKRKRKGYCTSDGSKAYNGSNSKYYYITPSKFYDSSDLLEKKHPADTERKNKCALDQVGNSHQVRSAGIRIFLPKINGVGVLRQRYPIMPIHGEGHPAWRELNALRDYVMNPKLHKQYQFDPSIESPDQREFLLTVSEDQPHHTHNVVLTPHEYRQLRGGLQWAVQTTIANGHQHKLILQWEKTEQQLFYHLCDDLQQCPDYHPKVLKEVL